MSAHRNSRRSALSGATILALMAAACTDPATSSGMRSPQLTMAKEVASDGEPNSAAGDTKAFIGAWLDGEAVELRYTRSYYCEQPPSSIAPTGCEIGALPEDFPRSGPIPVIYAIAPVGFTPADPNTLHCPGAPLCPNHPPMIDVTRLNIPNVSIAARAPHSHIITSRQAGWHRTVNIRVLDPSVWDQIVASPSLETVRRLQATVPGQISGDNPTNIFFFFHPAGASAP